MYIRPVPQLVLSNSVMCIIAVSAQCSTGTGRVASDRMTSIEQLSQMVTRHLGLDAFSDELQYTTKWTIFESPLGGRGLVATEDIKTGDVLFVDHPLVYGPRCRAIVQRGCTVCRKIHSDTLFKCSRCALLLCSEQCQNSDVHFSDCSIISCWPNKVPIEDVDDALLSRALTSIRAMLLNEEQRNLLTSLQAHVLPQHGSEIRKLKEYFDIPIQVEQFLTLVACILDANAFQIGTLYGKKELSLHGLYPVSAIMNHNCVSNTRYSFNTDSQMTVKAVKPIQAGSEIFTCYTGMLWGTPSRRLHLYSTKHFLCTCDRCADPTERGTLLAALKCFSSECLGSLLPLQPLKTNTAWKCLDCGLRVPHNNICTIQGALGSLVGSLDFDNVLALENYLLNRITKYVPKTNQVVVDLQCRLIWEIGEAEGFRWHELAAPRLALAERLCRGTLRTLAALGAGEALLRGLLLYHLHAALAERARREPHLS
ncbi:SET domain-containing protein SmydA-8 isoform X2 [Bicyclus anynana]|uniref:SET domain-containing protein SmydA-8 isoform X2 n=1 Tax=Bicyclus anynana TaxID=110368 RepID=A0A6J1N962_BICAN|nr:SET domain-containing protein SmydA-8 isoform X2 [Bicyclus anynana]